ncbi:MAG: Hsp20/alpha crystallin family protein [Anaerolineales bacterium]|nr:Hsp20/alpha crystallin family protein [Anaerolineales bacterium]
MSNITKWEPFRDLSTMRKDMDRLFDEFFAMPSTTRMDWSAPMVDMYQTENDIVVKATLPGLEPEDLDIQITGELLTVRGELKEETVDENAKYHLREHRYQSFSRSLTLPAAVIADKSKAEMKNGVLTLTLPKAEEAKPKVITVKAK